MANKFTIVITAVDRGTAVVRKFKDQIGQITRPVRQTMTSFKKFGKEIGLDKIAKAFIGVTKFAAGAAMKIISVGAAMAGVIAVGSGVALANMTRQWAYFGSAIQRQAAVIGISTNRLQTLSGAAKIFGLQSEDMRAGLQSLGGTMEDALYGRNQDALVMMNRLGIRLHRTKSGAVDAAAGLMDVARAISRIHNAQAQAVVARTMGVENLLPLLQRGPEAIKSFEDQWRATQALLDPGSLQRMTEFQQKIELLKASITGLGNSIGARLLPMLLPAVRGLTDFIEKISIAITKHQEALVIPWLQQTLGLAPTPAKPGQKPSAPWITWESHGKPLEYNWANPMHWAGALGRTMVASSPIGAFNGLVELIRRLEGSGPNSVSRPAFAGSRGGAVGVMQIMPATAAAYGYDPARLRDPKYNMMVGRAIIGALAKQYHNDLDDILIGYNSTPRYVDRFNKSHRNLSVLLPETQRYVERAHGDPALRALIAEITGKASPAQETKTTVHSVIAAGTHARTLPAQSPKPPQATHLEITFKNAPPGTTAKVKSSPSATTQLKINYAMPDLATP